MRSTARTHAGEAFLTQILTPSVAISSGEVPQWYRRCSSQPVSSLRFSPTCMPPVFRDGSSPPAQWRLFVTVPACRRCLSIPCPIAAPQRSTRSRDDSPPIPDQGVEPGVSRRACHDEFLARAKAVTQSSGKGMG